MTKYKWEIPTDKDKIIGWQGNRIITLEDEIAKLKEAVALMLAALDSDQADAMVRYFDARAEVDRLIANECAADCEGEE